MTNLEYYTAEDVGRNNRADLLKLIKESSNVKALKEMLPELDCVYYVVRHSGFCDGDAEYFFSQGLLNNSHMDEQEVIIEMLQESKGLGWREAEDKAKDMSFSDLSKEDFKSCIVEMVKCHTEGSSVTMDYWSDDLTRFNDDKEHFDKHLAQILEMKEEFRSEFIKDYSTVAMLTGGVHLGKEFNGFCKIELD